MRHRRLPDPLTLPPGVAAIAVSAVLDVEVTATGVVWPALYLLMGLIGGGIGGGDLKLAVPLGILVAAIGGLPAVLTAIVAAGLISTLTAWRSGTTPHGPAMILATAGCAVGFS
ncbi:prepilin peptidase [Corynebacterium yudongzhengii]|uniref:Prepilin peptidase n=2 Tax=Corynebacterium yudongzhengii TaxID=2080740 RepID=A0A2U1T7Y1_9CORY|nr:prepilin peptidase [Corynebacterium yudongzhengii]PWC02110.1 prepilin peptidase [Corynebacterium yudongzhengii]